MQGHVGHAVEPELPLLIEVGIVERRAPVHEIAADMADRALDCAFGLRTIGTTRGVKPQWCAKRRNSALRTSTRPRGADRA
jgi:hypothetical protein